MTPRRTAHLLLVEDNPADARLFEMASRESKRPFQLHVVEDAPEALDFLYRRGSYPNAVRPDLVVLDLNLPRGSGHDVLEAVKADPALAAIPVVVLSSSRARADIERAYTLHTNSYIGKPIDYDAFVEMVQAVERYWLEIVQLPVGADRPRSRGSRDA